MERVAGRIGGLLAYFRRAEPGGAAPSGWALALDAAVAVGAAATAVLEVAQRTYVELTLAPTSALPGRRLGAVVLSSIPLHISPLTLIATAMTALPLAARRLYPITAWLAIIAAIIAVHPVYVPPVALGTAVYGAYSAVVHSRYRNLAIVTVLAVAVATAVTLGNQLPRFPGRLTAIFAIAAAAGAGLGIRVLRRRLADSTARLRRATAEHEAATRQALTAERARIASELHDVVTHNVSVMVVQAGAARTVLASSPVDAEAALLAVEASGRTAMAELRNLLGLLSPPADGTEAGSGAGTDADPHAALRPQPGLHALDELIGRVSAAGLPVRLQVSGEPRPLPPGADLAAYRVVQEGLTNVLRHAGRAAASVAVQWGEKLVITVSDDGAGSWLDNTGSDNTGSDETGPCGAPGRGLLGLGERLSLYGGELDAGPLAGGGWRVRAVLPA
jgi:signal transduction histidine kinase